MPTASFSFLASVRHFRPGLAFLTVTRSHGEYCSGHTPATRREQARMGCLDMEAFSRRR